MRRLSIVAALAALVMAGEAAAQSTGTPVFLGPYRLFRSYEFGGSLSDPGGPGWALEGFYRFGWKKHDIGFRGGIADARNTDTRLLIGADFRTQVLTYSQSFPLDGAITLGLGANFGDPSDVGYVPIGLSLGRRLLLEGSQTSFVPYVAPVLTPTFGDQDDLLVTLGVGVDIQFSRSLGIKVSGALGDLDGISVSLSLLH